MAGATHSRLVLDRIEEALREIVDKVSTDVREVVASDEVKQRLIELGAVPAGTTPAQFQALINSDRKRYEQVIKDKNIKPET